MRLMSIRKNLLTTVMLIVSSDMQKCHIILAISMSLLFGQSSRQYQMM